MLLEALFVIVGTFMVLKGSEWITDSVSEVAGKFRTTNVAVALVLVSALFSLPELIVAILGIMKGHVGLSLGVSIGSVIINIGLGLGLAALIRPIKTPRHIVARDGLFMVVVTLIVAVMIMANGEIKQSDGVILILLYIPYMVNIYVQEGMIAKKEQNKESKDITKTLQLFGKLGVDEIEIKSGMAIMLIGTALTLVGAELFTRGLISIGQIFNISDILLGITVGALGTSIPNIVSSIQAIRKGYDEIAVTETIGSNIFTLLITTGIIGLSGTVAIDSVTTIITAPMLLLGSLLVFVSLLRHSISRETGMALVLLYIVSTLLEVTVRLYI